VQPLTAAYLIHFSINHIAVEKCIMSDGAIDIAALPAMISSIRQGHLVPSLLQRRVLLERALDIRFPRLISRKPTLGGLPLGGFLLAALTLALQPPHLVCHSYLHADIYQLVQAIHILGGAKKVEDDSLWDEVITEMGLSDVSNAKYNISTQYRKHLRWVLHPDENNDDDQWAAEHGLPALQDFFHIPAPSSDISAADAVWYSEFPLCLGSCFSSPRAQGQNTQFSGCR
jgi:hypothetical protein